MTSCVSDSFSDSLLGNTVEYRLQLKAPIAIFPVCERIDDLLPESHAPLGPPFSVRFCLGYRSAARKSFDEG